MAVSSKAYTKEELDNSDEREVLKIHPYLAPYKVTILPLVKKYHSDKAMELYASLCKDFNSSFVGSSSFTDNSSPS